MTSRLAAAIGRGTLILDAGMGTRLIARGLDLRTDDPALWNLSRPDDVADVHARDVAAGAEVVLTNTFGANRPWLASLGRAGDLSRINRAGVSLARRAAGPDRFVVGSIGPTASQDADAYREQADVLLEAGVDGLLLETHRADQAELGLRELAGRSDVPVLVSLAAWPEPVGPPARRLADLGASALGANCLEGMAPALRLVETLRAGSALPLLMKPGSGRPGRAVEPPECFAEAVPELFERGVRLIGGCCGTTEEHVAALAAARYRWERRSPTPA